MNTDETPLIQMKRDDEDKETPSAAIGETTPVRLGLTLSILGIVSAGIIGSAVWVATQLTELKAGVGAMQTTLTTLAASGTTLKDDVFNHKAEDARQWSEIKTRVQILEASGSPAVRELQKEMQLLENEFKVYKAVNEQRGGRSTNP